MELADVEAKLLARWPEVRIDPSIDRIAALVDLLGSPQLSYPTIHIGGTNGKTTVTRVIDSLFRSLDFRTGRFTSPHLESICERIAINGFPIPEAGFVATYQDIAAYLDLVDAKQPHPLSFFETITAMAFVAFAEFPVDIGLIEVGMGGEWDSTNVINSAVSILTPISFDHMQYLGNTIEEIAKTKSGIMKEGSQVVIGAQPEAAAKILLAKALAQEATPFRYGVEFGVKKRSLAVGGQLISFAGIYQDYDDIFLPIYGEHQSENAALALAGIESYVGKALDSELIRTGFANSNSPGRLEVLHSDPFILVDAAHNPDGAKSLSRALASEFDLATKYGVIAILGDKDVEKYFAEIEGTFDQLILTKNSSPRSMDLVELEKIALKYYARDKIKVVADLNSAIDEAITQVNLLNQSSDFVSGVVISGSVVTAGEARGIVRKRYGSSKNASFINEIGE